MRCVDLVALEEAINEIRRYYAIGKNIAGGVAVGMVTNGGITFTERRYDLSTYAASKAIQFAEVYSEAEKNELCELCHKHYSAPCISLIRMLLGIKNKVERRALQTQAIVDCWTTRQLRDEINHMKRLKRRAQVLNVADEPWEEEAFDNEDDEFDNEEYENDDT